MAGIDEVLERLVVEPEFREQLRRDAAAALSGYVLYDEDLQVLAATLDESAGGDHDVEQRTSKSSLLGLVVGFSGTGGGGGAPDADLIEPAGRRNDGFKYEKIEWTWQSEGLSDGPDDVLAAADGVPVEPVAIQDEALADEPGGRDQGGGPDDGLTAFEDTKGDMSGSRGGSAEPDDTAGAEGLVGSKGESPDGDPDQPSTDRTAREPPDDSTSAIDNAETQDSWESIS